MNTEFIRKERERTEKFFDHREIPAVARGYGEAGAKYAKGEQTEDYHEIDFPKSATELNQFKVTTLQGYNVTTLQRYKGECNARAQRGKGANFSPRITRMARMPGGVK